MIEGAILRRPVLSLLTPEFAGTQEGTLHFHYLLPENGGFLRVAHSLAGTRSAARRGPEEPRARASSRPSVSWPPSSARMAWTSRLHAAAGRRARARGARHDRRAVAGVDRDESLPGAGLPDRRSRDALQRGRRAARQATAGEESEIVEVGERQSRRPRDRQEIAKSQAQLASDTDKLARTVARRTSKASARARRTAVSVMRWPYTRAMRLLRLARYGVATRILGRR